MNPILIIDDDPHLRELLSLHLRERGFETVPAGTAAEGEQLAREHAPCLVLLDVTLPDRSGIEVLGALKAVSDAPVVVITAREDMDTAVRATRSGAFDFATKPLDVATLDGLVDRALAFRQATGEAPLALDLARSTTRSPDGELVGRSAGMQEVFKRIGRVASSATTVLLTGETGTGKEVVARALHAYGAASKPFIAVNCAALVDTLLESELFGHERGAFTGAVAAKAGKCELAGDGTLFLDEIGELSSSLQAKLLRLLQEREFERVGGVKRLALKARIVAATHRDLTARVREGTFREDLYQRLRVLTIELPPLRQRREDIPLLVEHLLPRINARLGASVTRVPESTLAELVKRPWYGNVRELENGLTRAVVMAPGNVLLPELLPPPAAPAVLEAPVPPTKVLDAPRPAPRASAAAPHDEQGPILSIEQMEKELIIRAIRYTGGQRTRASQLLGITRPTLLRKLRQFGLLELGREQAAASKIDPLERKEI